MQKEKFITVMAILDDDTQKLLHSIQSDLEQQYGADTKTKGIPFHITLGSYAVEETEEIVTRIVAISKETESFGIKFLRLNHFGNVVRYIQPEINEALLKLHSCFDSDYANGYDSWMPHVTIYRHSEPAEIELSDVTKEKLDKLTDAKIVGIELGEFFPPKMIVRKLFQ